MVHSRAVTQSTDLDMYDQAFSVHHLLLSVEQNALNSFVTDQLASRTPFSIERDEEIHVILLDFSLAGLDIEAALRHLVGLGFLLRFHLVQVTEGSTAISPDLPDCRIHVSQRLVSPILIAVRKRGARGPGTGQRTQ